MNTTKKQHYVPRSYLLRFSRRGKLFAFDKSSGRSFPTNVKDVASERMFYDLPALDIALGELQALEKSFQGLEQAGSDAIARVIEAADRAESSPINERDRIDLAIYLAVQFIRTKETRTFIVQTNELIHAKLLDRLLNDDHPELAMYRDAIKLTTPLENQIALHASLILDQEWREEIAQALYLRSWVLLRCADGDILYTSDHPVVAHSDRMSRDYGRGGLLSKSSVVNFPLSSRYVLLLVDPEFYPSLNMLNGTVQAMNAENLTYQNHLQVRYAYRQVYCEQMRFSLAETMLNENLALGDLQFPRVST